jgi:hypothetical protein
MPRYLFIHIDKIVSTDDEGIDLRRRRTLTLKLVRARHNQRGG